MVRIYASERHEVARVASEFTTPLRRRARQFPFHAAAPQGAGVTGFVMVEQVKWIDYRARAPSRIGRASYGFLDELLSILDACLHRSRGTTSFLGAEAGRHDTDAEMRSDTFLHSNLEHSR